MFMLRSALAALALAASGNSTSTCTIEKQPGDQVAQGHDLVIEAGQKVHAAVAVDGNVIIKKGAIVDDAAFALHGSVTVESGAEVKGNALAIGGTVHARGTARIDQDAIALGGGLDLDPTVVLGGHRVAFSIDLGDGDLAQKLVDQVLGPNRRCQITSADAGKR